MAGKSPSILTPGSGNSRGNGHCLFRAPAPSKDRAQRQRFSLPPHQIRSLIQEHFPGVTRKELEEILALNDIVPPRTRRPRYDPQKVLAAHDAHIAEDRKRQNCKSACDWVSKQLGVTDRTIQKYLAVARSRSARTNR